MSKDNVVPFRRAAGNMRDALRGLLNRVIDGQTLIDRIREDKVGDVNDVREITRDCHAIGPRDWASDQDSILVTFAKDPNPTSSDT